MKRAIILAAALLLAGCTRAQPTASWGGELPLDQDGGAIAHVSGTTGALDPRPLRPVGVPEPR